ncbi:Nramp family divalent metal transporter [Oceanithermus sp.]|uniref:Nramp family divalent metal transporter n=1 Tax=Oceanithermus sp. TaxID=2268145 RepID=UPI0025CC8276|nr:Nramp family divalent metal transporter [Oceanithermus sp.]
MKTAAAPLRRPFWYYLGPAFLVSVGYMDPGNWATSLEAGSRYGYALLWIVTLSSAIAVLMQVLAAKLGIATGMDLAQAMRARYSPPVARFLFVTAFLAMMATDLAEFMGVALALNLLFGIPLTWAVVLTVFDVLLILWLERFGFRWVEMVILAFVATIGMAYVLELFFAHPNPAEAVWNAFVPNATVFESATALFLAMGILGATVMPHNLYLHSAQVKTRTKGNPESKRRVYFWSVVDTVTALSAAWLVNGAILVMAAAVFHKNGLLVTEIDQAYLTLKPLLGQAAALTFAIALLASGISSSTTGTLAGQVVFEGFLNVRVRNVAALRLFVRLLTMAPALVAVWFSVRPVTLLVLSQVVLSMQLPFSVVPLVSFTSNPDLMGELANPAPLRWLAWAAAGLIVALNLLLLAFAVLGV